VPPFRDHGESSRQCLIISAIIAELKIRCTEIDGKSRTNKNGGKGSKKYKLKSEK